MFKMQELAQNLIELKSNWSKKCSQIQDARIGLNFNLPKHQLIEKMQLNSKHKNWPKIWMS